jgi:tetratricopeptide (TPR) repeat protein
MAMRYINSQITITPQALFLLFILSLVMMQGRGAEHGETDSNFRLGRQNYEKGDYRAAIEAFSAAVKLAPDTSAYHHWLGKSYGRLAEESNLFKAYRLAGKTREELERAVALDDKNIEATEDLMEFYLQAPVFLGGGKDKADKLRQRLEVLRRQNITSPDQQVDEKPGDSR